MIRAISSKIGFSPSGLPEHHITQQQPIDQRKLELSPRPKDPRTQASKKMHADPSGSQTKIIQRHKSVYQRQSTHHTQNTAAKPPPQENLFP